MNTPITKEFLEHEYIQLKKTYKTIALEIGCSKVHVGKCMVQFGIKPRKSGYRFDLAGKRFGGMVVLYRDGQSDKRHPTWLCRCDCGVEFHGHGTEIIRTKRSCGRCGFERGWGRLRTGCGNISGRWWSQLTFNANTRKLPVTVSVEDAWKLYEQQDGKCALTGTKLEFRKFGKGETTASLDRINSSLGYIPGNIQWVHKNINLMKWDTSQDQFIEWCAKVTTYTNSSVFASLSGKKSP